MTEQEIVEQAARQVLAYEAYRDAQAARRAAEKKPRHWYSTRAWSGPTADEIISEHAQNAQEWHRLSTAASERAHALRGGKPGLR